MKRRVTLGPGPSWAVLALVLLSIGGWVANVVKLFGMALDPLTGLAVLRIVGIFLVPLGAILGFL